MLTNYTLNANILYKTNVVLDRMNETLEKNVSQNMLRYHIHCRVLYPLAHSCGKLKVVIHSNILKNEIKHKN